MSASAQQVALLLGLGVALPCCKEFNPAYCNSHSDERCPHDVFDAPIVVDSASVVSCHDNSGCTSPFALVCDVYRSPGVCVECTTSDRSMCTDTKPVCGTSDTCEECRTATDCPLSGVCLEGGACADEGDVAYVDAAGTDNTMCTEAMPCTKISVALATQATNGAPRPYLKISGAISDAVTISRDVTLLADPGASLTRDDNGAILTVNGTSRVEIHNLTVTTSHSSNDPGISTVDASALTLKRVTVSSNKGHGVQCAGGSFTASESTFSGNGQNGIACSMGSVAVTSSIITKNAGGGLSAQGSSFNITNNFIYDNGDRDNSDMGGVILGTAGTASRFEFNTVVDNHGRDFISDLSSGVACDTVGFTAPNNIIAHNDIHDDTNRTNSNVAGRCTYPTSTIATSATDLMFVSPMDPRDYHLTAGSSAIGMARTATKVTTDFDGDARNSQNNDQGADQYKPPM
jgi:hypothetical protein